MLPVATSLDRVHQSPAERRSLIPEHADRGEQGLGIVLVELICPVFAGRVELDRPHRLEE
jgi:hypothetical protein